MTGRPMDRADLEGELAALAGAIDWPPTPDVVGRVRSHLAGAPAPVARRSWFPTPRLARPALLALLLLMVLAVAIAAAIALGLPGLRITFTSDPLPTPNVPVATATGTAAVSRSPVPTAAAPGANLGLGERVSPAEAARRLGLPLLMPAVPERPDPDAAFVALVQGSPVVTLTWAAGPSLPPVRAGSDVGLLVTVLRASVDEALLEKLVHGGTTVAPITIGGHRGFWISGGEHIVWFRRADGEVLTTPIRLAGDTLALEIDGRVVRLEVAGGREVAVALAETMAER